MKAPLPALNDLADLLGEEESRALVRLYLSETGAAFERLRLASPEQQRMTVHSVRGSSNQVGARQVADLCRELDTTLREALRPLQSTEISALLAAHERYRTIVEMWLQTKP